ncbi:MAG: redoxin domain-containing protein [Acidimicrobiia bacterium]
MSGPSAPGRSIPDFKVPASTGQTLSLDSYRGKTPLAIFFLPGIEMEEDLALLEAYNQRLAEFGRQRAQLMGVVKERARAVRDLADWMNLQLPILADASGAMIRDFGVDDPDGRARHALIISDRDGNLVRRFDPAPVGDQVEAALATIRGLGSGALRHTG